MKIRGRSVSSMAIHADCDAIADVVTDAVSWILLKALLFDDGDFSNKEDLGSS